MFLSKGNFSYHKLRLYQNQMQERDNCFNFQQQKRELSKRRKLKNKKNNLYKILNQIHNTTSERRHYRYKFNRGNAENKFEVKKMNSAEQENNFFKKNNILTETSDNDNFLKNLMKCIRTKNKIDSERTSVTREKSILHNMTKNNYSLKLLNCRNANLKQLEDKFKTKDRQWSDLDDFYKRVLLQRKSMRQKYEIKQTTLRDSSNHLDSYQMK